MDRERLEGLLEEARKQAGVMPGPVVWWAMQILEALLAPDWDFAQVTKITGSGAEVVTKPGLPAMPEKSAEAASSETFDAMRAVCTHDSCRPEVAGWWPCRR